MTDKERAIEAFIDVDHEKMLRWRETDLLGPKEGFGAGWDAALEWAAKYGNVDVTTEENENYQTHGEYSGGRDNYYTIHPESILKGKTACYEDFQENRR